MQIDALRIVGLPATDHQLAVLDGDAEIVHRKPGDSQCDPQRVLAKLLDVIRADNRR